MITAPADVDLSPGEAATFTGVYTLTQGDIDKIAGDNTINNVGSASGKDPQGKEVTSNEDPAEIKLTPAESLAILKDGVYTDLGAPGLNVGDTLNYAFKVTNTGNVTVTGVSINEVSFDLPGPIVITAPADVDLSPGASQTWTGVYTLKQEDIDKIFLDNTINNVGSATGKDPQGKNVTSNEDPAEITLKPNAAIDLVKVTVYAPPAAGPIIGDGITGVLAGDAVGWRYTVTNTGNVSLSKVIVIDDAGTPADLADDFLPVYVSGDANGDGKLGPLETWLYEASGVAIAGHYINLGTAYAYEIPPIELSGPLGPVVGAPPVVIPPTDIVDTDPSDYIAIPKIAIVKEVDANDDGIFADSETVYEGTRLVDYRFTVTAGDNGTSIKVNSFADAQLYAAGVTKTDLIEAFAEANGGSNVLAPFASVSFEINNVSLTLDDGTAGQDPFINTVTVSATDLEGTPKSTVEASDSATINVTNATPSIKIVKDVDANKDGIFSDSEIMLNADGTATYRYQLTNTSPASTDPLTIDTLVDDRGTVSTGDDKLLVSGGVIQPGVSLVQSRGDTDSLLETGETWTYAWTTTVPLTTETPSNKNLATVTAYDDENTSISAIDTASVRLPNNDYAQITPTNTTCDQYVNGAALDFSTYYAFQGGVIQYTTNKGLISSTNPGVFYYYTGLSGLIKGDGSQAINVFIDQSNNGPSNASTLPGNSEWNFNRVINDVNLYRVIDGNGNGMIDPTESCDKVTKGVSVEPGAERGDVTLRFTPLKGSLYVVGVKYDTASVKGLSQGALPTVDYSFKTNVYTGSSPDASIEETDFKGITLKYKFAPLLLTEPAAAGGETLKQDQLAPVVDAAIDYWATHGASAQGLKQLRSTDVLIGDLGGRLLGETDGIVVRLDDDAAGHGWSTGLGQVAAAQVDLYSTLTHEYGHMLGFEHDLLGESLDLGKRRLPFEVSAFPAAANPYAAV